MEKGLSDSMIYCWIGRIMIMLSILERYVIEQEFPVRGVRTPWGYEFLNPDRFPPPQRLIRVKITVGQVRNR